MRLRLALSLSIALVFLTRCEKEPNNPKPPAVSQSDDLKFCHSGGFPQPDSCRVFIIDFVASYGSTAKDSFVYDANGRLTESFYFHNGSYNSHRLFEYNDSCSVLSIIEDNDRDGKGGVFIKLFFNDQKLRHYLHLNPNDIADTLSQETYLYTNGELTGISGRYDGTEMMGDIITNAHGNVVEMIITERNGQSLNPPISAEYRYENIRNPFHLNPEFARHPHLFISPNACSEIVGSTTYNLLAGQGNLLKTRIDSFSQGVHIQEFRYTCF